MEESASETAESGIASPADEQPSPRWEEINKDILWLTYAYMEIYHKLDQTTVTLYIP